MIASHTACLLLLGSLLLAAAPRENSRNIRKGLQIPDEGYCDEPYVVVLQDGTWLCTLTTGPQQEGHDAQHVVSVRSRDQGKTWSELVHIEPSEGPEASWVVPLLTPYGRVYGFYSYNGDNVRTLNGKPIRSDTIGWYAYRFSDDGGRTWSQERYRIPLRVTACDRGNDWKGKVQIFWGIDKPWILENSVYFAFTKLGKYMLEQGEGWLLKSDNILWERDPKEIHWQLLPEGEHGIRSPQFGSTQEEHNVVPLSDGKSLYCVYRTTQGHPCHAYSRDSGKTWSDPEPMTYAPGERLIKTPRACARVWRTRAGRYLFWFHNHGGNDFQGRNPVWISGGLEKDGFLFWSQPEILLYDPDPKARMSYPDLIEEDGRTWVTETNKSLARVHEIDPSLLEGLWSQGTLKKISSRGRLLDLKEKACQREEIPFPSSLDLASTRGMTLSCWLELGDPGPADLIDSRQQGGDGFLLEWTEKRTFRLSLQGDEAKASWESDALPSDSPGPHHVAAIVEASPKLILFAIDGVLCDGGEESPRGWERYEGEYGELNPARRILLQQSSKEAFVRLSLYNRPLRVSEAMAIFHAGPGGD